MDPVGECVQQLFTKALHWKFHTCTPFLSAGLPLCNPWIIAFLPHRAIAAFMDKTVLVTTHWTLRSSTCEQLEGS